MLGISRLRHPQFKLTKLNQDWGEVVKGASVIGNTLRIGDRTYSNGIGTHANSRILITPRDVFDIFEGGCGIDSETKKDGSVQCQVLLDGKVAFLSKIMRGSDPASYFSLPVSQSREIILEVKDADDGNTSDHADWVDLRFSHDR